jgi:hypothetical protein
MKRIKLNSKTHAILTSAVILAVGALDLVPCRLKAQEAAATTPNRASATQPSSGTAAEAAAPPQTGLRGRGGFGGRGPSASPNDGGVFTDRPGSANASSLTNVAPAQFEATVYEVLVPANRIADLDAVTLESSAATSRALATAMEAFGPTKILYKVDQPVNLYGENIKVGSNEPLVTSTSYSGRNGSPINTYSYTSIGLIADISSPQSPKDPNRAEPNVQVHFQLSTMSSSGVEITQGNEARRIYTVSLSQSGTPKLGKPCVLVTVSAASADEKHPPVAYIIRYRFSEAKP